MSERRCRFCGRAFLIGGGCMNTRDMEDSASKVCFAALIAHGGGEYSVNQAIAAGIEACVRSDTPAGRAALGEKEG